MALCAVCSAAPTSIEAQKKDELERPSPINPAVLSDPKPPTKLVLRRQDYEAKHRQKRDDAVEKPHYVQTLESLQHKPQVQPEKLPSVGAPVSLQHNPTKQKREAPAKPDSVVAYELLQHDGKSNRADVPAVPEVLIAHNEPQKNARHARDIPVPTHVKTTSAPKEEKEEKPQVEDLNAHVPEAAEVKPHSPLRHHPVPVAELFNKPKTQPAASSAESQQSNESKQNNESKQSNESKENKESKA